MSESVMEACARLNSEGPDYDVSLQVSQGICFLMRAMAGGYPGSTEQAESWLRPMEEETLAEIQAVAEHAGPADQQLEVPRITLEEFTGPAIEAYLRAPIPLVLAGAAAHTGAVKTWTPALFGERYGDVSCMLVRSQGEQRRGTLADVWHCIQKGDFDGWYANNIANVFNQYPELRADLNIESVTQSLGGHPFLSQFFMGGPGTQTAFHCEGSHVNIFLNIYGEKRWYLVHPRHSALMYGEMHATGMYGVSPIDFTQSADAQADRFPLYRYAPRYTCTLGPGDVLINPAWWWHAVQNLSSASIACAARHQFGGAIANQNRLYEIASSSMPLSKKVMALAKTTPNFQIDDAITRDLYQY